MDKKILIISSENPTRSYSCIKYLYNCMRQKHNVTLWCAVSRLQIRELISWGINTHSFFDSIIGNIPKIRTLYMIVKGFFICLKFRNSVIICHELMHFRSCVLTKTIFPKTKIILYLTEIFDVEPSHNSMLGKIAASYYRKHLHYVDFCIECDYKRLEYRKQFYGLKVFSCSSVILNTLPLKEIQYFRQEKNCKANIPLIIYSGGLHNKGELDIIVHALSLIEIPYKIQFLVHGKGKLSEAIDALKQLCQLELPTDSYSIICGKSREEAFKYASKADIGILYYNPEECINNLYAAPSKFFEYMALGIPVVCSKNESLIEIIEKYSIGIYMKTNDLYGMSQSLEMLIKDNGMREEMSKNSIRAFDQCFCYEKQAKNTLEIIEQFLVK